MGKLNKFKSSEDPPYPGSPVRGLRRPMSDAEFCTSRTRRGCSIPARRIWVRMTHSTVVVIGRHDEPTDSRAGFKDPTRNLTEIRLVYHEMQVIGTWVKFVKICATVRMLRST